MYDARPEFILYHEFVLTSRNFIRIVSANFGLNTHNQVIGIQGEWLLQENPEYFNPEKIKNLETKRALEAAEKKQIMDLKKQKEMNNQIE